ncbi:MAG TPA: hypothetical protein VK629_01610, partial [Steroidobacteraceae bacterium]|nr:hypothetical protein [Steroidobacteraceae bacterium]
PPPSKTVRYFERSFEKLAALHPEATDIPKLRNLVAVFRNFHLNKEQVHKVTTAARELQNVVGSLHKRKVSNLQNSPADLQRISQITNQLRQMRNAIVHAVPPSNASRVRPAYRLDDGESDG